MYHKNKNHKQQSNGMKRKCCRNRKSQRLRAKLRKSKFDIKSTMILFNVDKTNKSIFKKSNCQYQERKIKCLRSLNQALMKRQLSMKQTNVTMDKSIVKQQKQLMKSKETFMIKPNYLTMTDTIFKQMLSTVFDDTEFIVQHFDTTEKLNYIRQYAQLINNLYCLKYEQDVCQTYYNISMIADVWSTTTITKEMAFENILHRYLFTTRVNTEKRQKTILDQLKKIQYDLNEYQQQIDDLSIDKKLLFKVIPTLVGNELHKLRTEYEWKKVLFQYDANDYRLVKLFYDLQPTEDLIYSAKLIWQITASQLKMEEQLFILKKNLSLFNQTIDNMEISLNTSEHIYKKDQLKNNSMIQSTIKITEETIENYKTLIYQEKIKILNKLTIRPSVPSTITRLINMIELRQNNMQERVQFCIYRDIFDSTMK